MDSPKYSDLSFDIQQLILLELDSSSLLNLARASRAMHIIAIPALYREVKLAGSPVNDHIALGKLQECFNNTLTEHPEYGNLVRSLAWVYTGLPHLDLPTRHCFQHMNLLEGVKFICLTSREQAVPHLPKSVKKVQLSGRMTVGFADLLLRHLDLSRLVSLEFDDRDGASDPRELGLWQMGNTLRQFTGRCTSLRFLVLKSKSEAKVKVWGIDAKTWDTEDGVSRDDIWISFIESVRPTLESFYFHQERCLPRMKGRGGSSALRFARQRQQLLGAARALDERLIDGILPLFLHGSWPRLRNMTIVGIGGEPSNPRGSGLWTHRERLPGLCDQLTANLGATATSTIIKPMAEDWSLTWSQG